MHVLGARPRDELDAEELGRGILKCRSCGKPVLEVAVVQHYGECLFRVFGKVSCEWRSPV